jgi:hypothetical protein
MAYSSSVNNNNKNNKNGSWCIKLKNSPLSVNRSFRKCGSPIVSQPYWPSRPIIEIPVPNNNNNNNNNNLVYVPCNINII